MKAFLIAALLSGGLFTVVFAQQDGKEEISELKKKIEVLEKKLAVQSEEISALKKEIKEIEKRNPLVALPDIKNPGKLPEGSREYKFNGQTYYLIPIDDKFNKLNKY